MGSSSTAEQQEAVHKCKLLDSEIPAITYNSGGTYTLGALQQAIDVFKVFFKVFQSLS